MRLFPSPLPRNQSRTPASRNQSRTHRTPKFISIQSLLLTPIPNTRKPKTNPEHTEPEFAQPAGQKQRWRRTSIGGQSCRTPDLEADCARVGVDRCFEINPTADRIRWYIGFEQVWLRQRTNQQAGQQESKGAAMSVVRTDRGEQSGYQNEQVMLLATSLFTVPSAIENKDMEDGCRRIWSSSALAERLE